MPRRKFDEDYVYEIIKESKEVFYSSPLFNRKTKELLESIKPCVIITKDMPDKWYATACIEHSKSPIVDEYELKEKMPYVIIEGRMSWHILEFNYKLLRTSNKGTVYDTVSHELAHLLEMRINGNYNRAHSRYHNALWKKIHRAMGGCGLSTEKGYREWLLKKKNKSDK